MPSPAYLSCTGSTQGLLTQGAFTADSVGAKYVQGHEDEVMVQSFSHSMIIPTDVQSGQPTGQRRHQPITIVKDIDKSSPLLANALTRGERLAECELRLYRTSSEGKQEYYYTIKLTDAIIININQGMPNARTGAATDAMETVSFSYRKIDWDHLVAGTSGSDDWRAPNS